MEKFYLATTALSDIWDTECRLLILGPWCLTASGRQKIKDNSDFVMVDSPWKPATKLIEAEIYCNDVYEKIMPEMAGKLNSIHAVEHPVKYWRILAGPWLRNCVEIMYDRYRRIENALLLYPDFYTHTLNRKNPRIACEDTYDFVSVRGRSNDDLYNFKLFSYVIDELCPEKAVGIDMALSDRAGSVCISEHSIKERIANGMLKIKDIFDSPSVILSDMYHLTGTQKLLLELKSSGHIGYRDFYPSKRGSFSADYSAQDRKKLRMDIAIDPFVSFLCRIIPSTFPVCFLENYRHFRKTAGIKKAVKNIGSAVGWYCSEEFKFFAAESSIRGSDLAEFQHGGCYGMSAAFPNERMALEKDILYTWGWVSNHKTKPLSSPYLSRLKKLRKTPTNETIIFAGNCPHKYISKFFTIYLADDMPKYFNDKKIFFDLLEDGLRQRISYCLYTEVGWEEKSRMMDLVPGINFLKKGRLTDQMAGAKAVIIDHLGTAVVEAMAMDIPCVLFWDHDVNLIRPEAEECFEALRKAGVLHRTPEAASKKVNEIHEDIMSWWQSPVVLAAKKLFCERYAKTSDDWCGEWIKQLKV